MNYQIPEKFRILSGSSLKMIAIVAMLIDHSAAILLFDGVILHNAPITVGSDMYRLYLFYRVLRGIGRIAFPIFCFLLVEGFLHTSNKSRYAFRLFLFALISEVPFDLALHQRWFDTGYQNVFFTLLIGFLVIWLFDMAKGRLYFQLPTVILGCLLAAFLHTDYDYRGVLLIVILYLFRYYRLMQTLAGAISLYWEWPAIFAFIPINLYNGRRGWNMKYFFYAFYPVHLFLLYFIYGIIF
ncbi:MAG: TraX family protein [Lachnospiraceae bacterium]|nr:TraX family protein [Lachnospiraceae bacterium]